MKIIIISDIHDNLVNLEKCLNWCGKNKVKKIICLGDITNSETLEYLAGNFKGEIFLVKSNIELFDELELKKYSQIKYCGEMGRLEINNKKIGICHEQYLADRIIKQGPVDIIFYGHTHKPWEFQKDGIIIINPGTLGGVFQKATFAVMEKENIKLILLEQI